MRVSAKVVAIPAASLALFAGVLAVAGPLGPAGGPIGSTYKTLTEVEPRIPISVATTPGNATSTFRITQPGSYYLTGNITGESGKHGIEIAAAYVSIDLNGYQLKGVTGSLKGVWIRQSNATIRNGSVTAFGDDGIGYDPGIPNSQVFSITSTANAGAGIAVGAYSEVRDCRAFSNSLGGIRIYSVGHLLDSVAIGNTGVGVTVSNAGNVIRNVSVGSNTGDGFYAIGSGNVFENCIATGSGGDGFEVDQCILRSCSASNNQGNGFVLGSSTQATGCSASSNTQHGFTASSMCTLDENSSDSNGLTVAGRYGFAVTGSGGRVTNNLAAGNANGFLISGANQLVHGNHAANNITLGFAVNGSANAFLTANSASGNGTPFSIGAGNDYGAIVTNPGIGFAITNPAANFAP